MMTRRKCVSLEVTPLMALWWACLCESLWISSFVGDRAAVICLCVSCEANAERHFAGLEFAQTFDRIASSMGVREEPMASEEAMPDRNLLPRLGNCRTVVAVRLRRRADAAALLPLRNIKCSRDRDRNGTSASARAAVGRVRIGAKSRREPE